LDQFNVMPNTKEMGWYKFCAAKVDCSQKTVCLLNKTDKPGRETTQALLASYEKQPFNSGHILLQFW